MFTVRFVFSQLQIEEISVWRVFTKRSKANRSLFGWSHGQPLASGTPKGVDFGSSAWPGPGSVGQRVLSFHLAIVSKSRALKMGDFSFGLPLIRPQHAAPNKCSHSTGHLGILVVSGILTCLRVPAGIDPWISKPTWTSLKEDSSPRTASPTCIRDS